MNKIIIYIAIVNFVSFIIFGIDKYLAIKNKRRISEKTLFFISIIGGSLGSILGMNIFRHKTKKKKFLVIYLFLIIHIIILKEFII